MLCNFSLNRKLFLSFIKSADAFSPPITKNWGKSLPTNMVIKDSTQWLECSSMVSVAPFGPGDPG